jgi:acyl-CoA dehydrogenase
MKSIYINEDLDAIRRAVREFVEREIVPNVDHWEEDKAVPRKLLDEMGKLGFFGLRVPEEYGGIGLGHVASVMFGEELGRCTAGGTAITILVHTDLATPYVTKFGTSEQKARWLPKFVSGELITAIGVTEPDAGSDVASLRTTAHRDGGGWRINVVFIAARTDSDVKGSRGLSLFAIEAGTEGFVASRALDKMGWHSSNTAELVLDDVWVAEENLVGEENRAFYYIMENFQNERLAIMGQGLGESQKAIELTLDYVKNRMAFIRCARFRKSRPWLASLPTGSCTTASSSMAAWVSSLRRKSRGCIATYESDRSAAVLLKSCWMRWRSVFRSLTKLK